MEQQPRDESRAATVREGGSESWTEAGELIDRPSNMPTAAGSREPDGEIPPGGGAAATGHTTTGTTTGRTTPMTTTRRATGPSASHVETRSPGGADFSSSAAPAGVGSNTPVGGEPEGFRSWDTRQDEPGSSTSGGMMSMMAMPSMSTFGGVAATATVGGLAYAWWRRRQARQTRTARMREMLMTLGASLGTSAGGELPRMVGQAAAQSKSAWLPLLLLPVALWLRERGKDGERASEQLLQPLDLDKRSERLTRQGADLLEAYRRRLVGDVDPNARRGWGRMRGPLFGLLLGGGFIAYRRGWLRFGTPSNVMAVMGGMRGMGGASRTMVRDVMTRGVETTAPDTTIADVARRMRDLDVGSLPVTEGSRLLGIVTDRDLSVRATATARDPNTTRVREVMSPELAWVFDDEPADAAARVMRERQIRRLPVLDRSDRLVGVVSLADLATDLGDDRLKGATLEDISQPSGAGSR